MATRTFQLFVRRFPGVGYAAHVLGEPHLASFAESMNDVYSDLTTVCGRLLDRGLLSESSTVQPFTMRRVDLTLRAMQRGRLLSVPMRFTVLVRSDAPPVK